MAAFEVTIEAKTWEDYSDELVADAEHQLRALLV
jgi:hypothetical protein